MRKIAGYLPLTDEMAIDLGMEPSPGYWARREAEEIAARRVRARLRFAVWRVRWGVAAYLGHVRDALLARRCDE